jgi:hypothetical protein
MEYYLKLDYILYILILTAKMSAERIIKEFESRMLKVKNVRDHSKMQVEQLHKLAQQLENQLQ